MRCCVCGLLNCLASNGSLPIRHLMSEFVPAFWTFTGWSTRRPRMPYLLMLAAVIVLDQFSRHMFRGTPSAFANDAKALAIARKAIAKGFADALSSDERLFLYLPFEHQESVDAQARSVELFSGLGDPELTKYAQAHKDIIDRFGRCPHRNAILGRTSTTEEWNLSKVKTTHSEY
jgi:uncharacterized protein (DUF924 family)